jgi:uncharacterized membrane protein YfcA
VLANVSNTVGLVPGTISGSIGYRAELMGQRSRLFALGIAAILGGLTGGILLLALPAGVFRGVVPVLILLAVVLAAVQPRVARWLVDRREEPPMHGGPVLLVSVFLTGVYGGYFGAAQGVILISLLGIFIADDLQRLNATKNVLTGLVNGVAALLFIAVTHIAWGAAGILAVGSILGGQLGARVGRRLPAPLLRAVIILVGTGVAIRLLV